MLRPGQFHGFFKAAAGPIPVSQEELNYLAGLRDHAAQLYGEAPKMAPSPALQPHLGPSATPAVRPSYAPAAPPVSPPVPGPAIRLGPVSGFATTGGVPTPEVTPSGLTGLAFPVVSSLLAQRAGTASSSAPTPPTTDSQLGEKVMDLRKRRQTGSHISD